MKTLLLALLGICSISVSSAVTCYQCDWSVDTPTVQPECKEDATIPDTAAFTCPSTGGTAAVGCRKQKVTVNGVTMEIGRACVYVGEQEAYPGIGDADKGCIRKGYENGDIYACVCYDDKCNGASAATFGMAIILLLLAAAHQMIHH